MRILILFALVVFVGVTTTNAGEKFFPYPYENYTLDNGLKSILIPMKGSGLVAYYTVVRTGSRDEVEEGRTGFAHFFEHMMFRGTEKYPADVYSRILSEMGADANAYTSDDITCYYMVIPTEQLEQAIDLESDRFQRLQYEEDPFRTEAGAVYGEYRKNSTSPFRVSYEKMLETAFDKHTYQHTTMGFERDIKEMPNMYEYSKSFFQRFYRPENCVLLIVGDFDKKQVKKHIKQFYGEWSTGYVEPKVETEPEQTEERTVEVEYNGRTLPLVWIGYKGDAFDPASKDCASAYLLADLAYGENSEIYKKLVIREQKCQWVAADFGFNRDPKLYDVYGRVKKDEDVSYVIAEMDKTADEFKNELVSEEDLENVKKRTRYGYLMDLDTPDNVASSLARIIAITGGIEAVDELYGTMSGLTPEDIRAAALLYMQKERRTVLTLKGKGEES